MKAETLNHRPFSGLRRVGPHLSFAFLHIWVRFSLSPTGHLSYIVCVCVCVCAMTGPVTQLPAPWTAHIFIPAALMQRIQECLGDFHTCSKGGKPTDNINVNVHTVTWRLKNRVKGTCRDHACAWCWSHVVIIEIIKLIKRGLIESACLLE